MAGRTRTLTVFGNDLDSLLKRAGKFTLREYADECGVSYKYISQLRTTSGRRPGKLYVDLLKPFTRLSLVDLPEGHRLSLRHRGKPLSFTECRELFPGISEGEALESVRGATEIAEHHQIQFAAVGATITRDTERVGLEPPSRLHRRVFVGRQTELNELRLAFDAASAGSGGVVVVAGEPGIGKTTLCAQLVSYVNRNDGISLSGHCFESGILSLPYLAFVEGLRPYVLQRESADLEEELGSGAADVARIMPEITDRLSIPLRLRGDRDEEKYRLMQGVSDFLGRIAATKPTLFVLEDLHKADLGTLEMLQYVAHNLGGKRLLLLGTYRNTEVDRSHPLSGVLAELRRLPCFAGIALSGLDAEEVTRMISGIAGLDTPAGLGETVHRQTEGNPLFVEEVARYLVEQGLIGSGLESKSSTQWVAGIVEIPRGLKDVVGKRLSELGAGCVRMLAVAAVIGRDFRVDILESVCGMSQPEILAALEEACRAGLIEEGSTQGTSVIYRFTHVFFLQTLCEEMLAPERKTLHRKVARTLERVLRSSLDEHAAELGEHFSQSSEPSDLRKAVGYWERAGKRAMDVFAYGEAVRALRRALSIQESVLPQNKTERCDLVLAVCEALWLAGEPRHMLNTEAPAALSLAEETGDRLRASRACKLAMWAAIILGAGASQAWVTEEAAWWVERADRSAVPNTDSRAWADFGRAMTLVSKAIQGGEAALFPEGISLLRKVLGEARDLGDSELWWIAACSYLVNSPPLLWHEERLQLADELARSSRSNVSLLALGTGLLFAGLTFLERGNRQRVEELWREHRIVTERTEQPYYRFQSMQIAGYLACLDGRLEEAVDTFRRMQTFGDEHGLSLTTGIIASVGASRPLVYLGKPEEALRLVSEFLPGPLSAAFFSAHLGRVADVVGVLDELILRQPFIGTPLDVRGAWQYVSAIEAAVVVRHRSAAALLLELLSNSSVVTTGIMYPTCISRHLGGAAAMLGRYDEARRYYQEAIRICTGMRFRPELALSRLQLAELMLEHYPGEQKDALGHLDFAVKEFREMNMQPSLEKALRLKGITKA